MGISINVNAKQDYSYLFQSMSGNRGGGFANLNFLSDYASIKNGSYGKLMKAYYAKDSADDSTSKTAGNKDFADKVSSSVSTSADSAKTLSGIEKAADGLKESADDLITRGTDSVFNKKEVAVKDEYGFETTKREYDTDAIYQAVSAFARDYNSLIEAAGESHTRSISSRADSLMRMTDSNKNLLADVGITINEDKTLSVNEEAFKKADMSTAKTLFNGNSSYAYQVSAQASLIDFAADREGSRANTYTINGTYGNAYTSGNIMDFMF